MAALLVATPAQAQTTDVVRLSGSENTLIGQLVEGDRLDSMDELIDCYAFAGKAGQSLFVSVRTQEAPPFLTLYEGGTCQSSATLANGSPKAGEEFDEIEHRLAATKDYSVGVSIPGRNGEYGLLIRLK